MAAEIDLIADAVAAALNTKLAAWGHPSVVAQKRDAPQWEVSELNGMHVTVVPLAPRQERVARRRVRFEYDLSIDVRRRTKALPAYDRDVANLMQLVSEHFEKATNRRLSAVDGVECSKVEAGGYAQELLNEKGIYATAAVVTFTVLRAPR